MIYEYFDLYAYTVLCMCVYVFACVSACQNVFCFVYFFTPASLQFFSEIARHALTTCTNGTFG